MAASDESNKDINRANASQRKKRKESRLIGGQTGERRMTFGLAIDCTVCMTRPLSQDYDPTATSCARIVCNITMTIETIIL